MSKTIKSIQAAIQAVRALEIPRVSVSVMGASHEACIEIDYAEAGIEDPAQLEPIYKAIGEALAVGDLSVKDGICVGGIETIKIQWPAFLVKVDCDGITALYDPEIVALDNHGAGVAFLAYGVCIGHADADMIDAPVKIIWDVEEDALEDENRISSDWSKCAEWDAPESIRIV